jgi:hypothetical protein
MGFTDEPCDLTTRLAGLAIQAVENDPGFDPAGRVHVIVHVPAGDGAYDVGTAGSGFDDHEDMCNTLFHILKDYLAEAGIEITVHQIHGGGGRLIESCQNSETVAALPPRASLRPEEMRHLRHVPVPPLLHICRRPDQDARRVRCLVSDACPVNDKIALALDATQPVFYVLIFLYLDSPDFWLIAGALNFTCATADVFAGSYDIYLAPPSTLSLSGASAAGGAVAASA